MKESSHAVVLFDGVCNLCDGLVNFLIEHDPEGTLRFAALQSEAASPYLERCRLTAGLLEGIVLVEADRFSSESTAVLRIFWRLGGPWRIVAALLVVPRPIRNAAYRWIARNRYRWFGRRDACRVPTPELEGRFLPGAAKSPEPGASRDSRAARS